MSATLNDDDSSGVLARAAAESLKTKGNSLFKEKDYEGAIKAYTEAILLEADGFPLHVVYSNRSAAFLASGDAKSKALKDAERCVALAPDWAKGYGRLGAAQSSLGRFAEAQASYVKARELDPSSTLYDQGLQAAKEGERRAIDERIAKEREEARLAAVREAAENEARRASAERDEALGDFFAALGDAEAARKRAAKPINEKYKNQDLGTGSSQISRLTQSFHEFKNLNAFAVLQLDVDATVDDVKMRYRKLSALCHPDKNLNDPSRARTAFEAIKTAYQALCDDKTRDRMILVIQGARDRARLASKDEEKEIMKTFAQNEMKRRDVEEHKRVQAARERAQVDEARKKEESEKKFEEQWNQDDRRNQRVGFWQQFQDDADRAGNQKRIRTAKNYKPQEKDHKKPKYGQADVESWKREWK